MAALQGMKYLEKYYPIKFVVFEDNEEVLELIQQLDMEYCSEYEYFVVNWFIRIESTSSMWLYFSRWSNTWSPTTIVSFMDIWMAILWCPLRFMMFLQHYWRWGTITQSLTKYSLLLMVLLLDIHHRKETLCSTAWIQGHQKHFEVLWLYHSLCLLFASIWFSLCHGTYSFVYSNH